METKKIYTTEDTAATMGLDACTHEIESADESVQTEEIKDKPSKTGTVVSAAAGVAVGVGIGAAAAGVAAATGLMDGMLGTEEAAAAEETDYHDAIADMTAGTEAYVEPQPVEMPAAPAAAATSAAAPAPASTVTAPTVNPDEVADDIIAAEFVDPVDAAAPDQLFDVADVGYVYNVNGESMLTATVHDAAGNELYMVDVNGDNILDVVADQEGNVVDFVLGGATQSDLQLIQAQAQGEEPGYIANEDNNLDLNDNSFEADIIDPTTFA